jgi:hypothetical protein
MIVDRATARLLCDGTNPFERRKVKEKQDIGLSKLLRAIPKQKLAASSELNCLFVISAVREY